MPLLHLMHLIGIEVSDVDSVTIPPETDKSF
jgi:hypothetical protein